MLYIDRRPGEKLLILIDGVPVDVVVHEISYRKGQKTVFLGTDAPREIVVLRGELAARIERERASREN